MEPGKGAMGTGRLHLGLFGSLTARLDGRLLRIGSGPARRVLGYLALNSGRVETRGRLAAVLWEQSDESHARQNLRQALHALGRVLGPDWPGLRGDRTALTLAEDHIVCDLDTLLQQIDRGEVPDALLGADMRPERLLADEVQAGEMFESWLRLRRRDYENRLREGLERVMQSAARPVGRRAAQALLGLDASDEAAARFLIRDLHAAGETGRALSVYEALWNHLDEVYDTEPGLETQTLIAAVKSGPPVRPVRAEPPSQRLRIGLGPVAGDDDPHTAGPARLFRAELMATLLRFRTFELVDLGAISRPVDFVLDLSVGAGDGQLLLLAVLTRSADGVVIWSERWSGLTRNWLRTQAGLVARLASACSIHISQARIQEIGRAEIGASAMDDWLLGNVHLDRFRADGLRQAAACFESVVRKAPEASMGYSSLARLRNGMHLMQPGLMRTLAVHRDSKAMASRAVALDPLDSRAHLHRGWACCLLGEYDPSAASFAMARQCNPNDPWTVLSSALGAAFSDDPDLAERLCDRALAEGWITAPFQWGFIAPIRFVAGDDAGCVEAAENAQDAIINIPAWKAAALWHLGQPEAARTAWAEFETLSKADWAGPDAPDTRAILSWFLSCFPIRRTEQRRRLAEGASGAAGVQVHWVQA